MAVQIMVASHGTSLWNASAQLVAETYEQAFQAHVRPAPDAFIVGWADDFDDDPQTGILACVGINTGERRSFFAEQYLDEPAERAIGHHLDLPCDRRDILELGSLASRSPQAGMELLRAMPVFGWAMGRRYGLCTITKQLTVMLRRLAYPFQPLAPAVQERLAPGERERWGSYYEQSPRTGLVQLDDITHAFTASRGRYLLPELRLIVNSEARERTRVLA